MNVALLAHEGFPDRAKTAVGVLRYAEYEVCAVLDREHAGERVRDHLPDVQDAPIVAGIEDVPERVDALVIGIAPIGGDFDERWRPDVRGAIERGCDVLAGLHYFLAEDDEFAALADEHGVELRDLRRPPDDLTVAEGRAREVDADVVLTVGTDCSTGKMTTSAELVAAARERGIDAALVPTGQTGVLIEDWGIVVDRTASDFTAGAVERMVRERGADHDLLVVEGQGSITHPAYSAVTCGILHGAMPDALVLCHEAGREAIHGYEPFAIPPVPEVVSLYEDLAAPVAETTVAAGALNTADLDEGEANRAIIEYATAIDAPATDPVRFDAAELLDALV
ncbi:DUF1611 domain-containing protein [Halorientalis halophila]|uniref:DUF1611 domain-containing protein n=1 Tax=Halorientalis halophila TaxID=3108499 RepID=UPI00300A32EB